jgi:hypothetical protein
VAHYKWVGNKNPVEETNLIVLATDDEGNATESISRGGPAVKLNDSVVEGLSDRYYFEKTSAEAAKKEVASAGPPEQPVGSDVGGPVLNQ